MVRKGRRQDLSRFENQILPKCTDIMHILEYAVFSIVHMD